MAGHLARSRREHGPDSVAVFGGGGLTNEKAYQLGKFARVALGTSQIDYNGRWCMSSAASAGNQAFGIDRGLPFPLADVERTDVLVLVGSNLAETMPPAARHLDRLRERGGRVVVIDPRLTPTAERADLFLQPVPGTDLPLALGVLHLLDAVGALDTAYVAARTTGVDDVRRTAAAWWPERVERVSGVPASDLRELADLLAGADRVMVLTARGAEQHSQGTATVLAWINVALALGMCGKDAAGYGCLTGQGNGQGGREHGQKSDQLPGYRMIDDPAARAHVAGVWGVEAADLPGKGRSAYELLDALGTEDGPSSLLVFGSNIVVSAPNATQVTERLASLDLLVVADIVMSETAAMADVVLPVTQWAEETGTMTNLEGRVILRERAVAAARAASAATSTCWPGWRSGWARRCRSPSSRRRSSPSWAGPRPAAGPTTPASPTSGSVTSTGCSGRARAPGIPGRRGCSPTPSRTTTAARGSSTWTTWARPSSPARTTRCTSRPGGCSAQYQSGAQTRRVRDLPDDGIFVELHPMLADRIGADDGDPVVVTTRRGELKAPARVVATIRPDTIFVPFHWVGANRLTNDALDPSSRMPEFKVCSAAVRT